MAIEHEDELKDKENPRPLDEDDIALLKTYNKERAVNAGVVKPLVDLVAEQGTGLAEKAMVVLNSLAGVQDGKHAIVEEGGIAALVEAIEDSSPKQRSKSSLAGAPGSGEDLLQAICKDEEFFAKIFQRGT